MNFSPSLVVTFVLLALSICAVWIPALRVSGRNIEPWAVLFAGAVLSGLAAGALKWPALVGIAVLILAAMFSTRKETRPVGRYVLVTLAALIALAFAFHRFPGFNNPILIERAQFSVDAATYTQWANFDKATAGLILLVFFCKRARTAADWREVFTRTFPVALLTAAIVIGAAMLVGYVRPMPKLPAYTPIFLATNLLFVCVAEEAFFRGFLQHRLAGFLASRNVSSGGVIALIVCAVLFGLVHFAGGATYVALSTLAGLGYGYAYLRTQRVEAPILAHFALNVLHFLGFTYPRIA
jgi:uncharacterized protein